jgi:hypothetical protein
VLGHDRVRVGDHAVHVVDVARHAAEPISSFRTIAAGPTARAAGIGTSS